MQNFEKVEIYYIDTTTINPIKQFHIGWNYYAELEEDLIGDYGRIVYSKGTKFEVTEEIYNEDYFGYASYIYSDLMHDCRSKLLKTSYHKLEITEYKDDGLTLKEYEETHQGVWINDEFLNNLKLINANGESEN